MLRLVFRALGYLLLACGFAVGVLDGAAYVANGAASFTPLGASLFAALGETFLLIQPAIERHLSPVLWERVVLPLTLMPTAAVALVLGGIVLALSRPRRRRDDPLAA